MKKSEIDNLVVKMGCTSDVMPDEAYVVSDECIIAEILNLKDKESTDRDGRTLLLNAVCYERTAVAEFLIKAGVDINRADSMGFTPLHIAVQKGNIKLTKMLLKNGADINAKDNFGNNAIRSSKLTAPVDLFELLLEYGADPSMKNDYGYSAIDTFSAYPEIISVLMKH